MALELASFPGKFADLRQGEDLESSAVGQDGSVPGFELVQASGLAESLQTRSQIQVIGVAQDYLGAYVFLELLVVSLQRSLTNFRDRKKTI